MERKEHFSIFLHDTKSSALVNSVLNKKIHLVWQYKAIMKISCCYCWVMSNISQFSTWKVLPSYLTYFIIHFIIKGDILHVGS